MKKYLSVYTLFLRQSLPRLALTLPILFVIEAALFLFGILENEGFMHFDQLISDSYHEWLFLAALIIIAVGICSEGGRSYCSQLLTIERLRIGKNAVFLTRGAAYATCYLVAFASEIISVSLFLAIWCALAPDGLPGAQEILITLYRDPYLHSLIPLEDLILYPRNIILILSLGFCTAADVGGRAPFKAVLLLLIFGFLGIYSGLGDIFKPISLSLIALIVAAISIIGELRREKKYDD